MLKRQREEKQKMETNKTENNEPKQEEEVLISVVRIKRATGLKEEYQYDMKAIHYTMNCLNHMEDIQKKDLQVEGHDSTVTQYQKKGTIDIQHLRKTNRYMDTLYYLTYSNLINSQRAGGYSFEVSKSSNILIKGKKLVYHMRRDDRDELFISIERLQPCTRSSNIA